MGHNIYSSEGWENGSAPSPSRAEMLGQWSHVGSGAQVLKVVAGWLQVCRLVREANPGEPVSDLLLEATSDEFATALLVLFSDCKFSLNLSIS